MNSSDGFNRSVELPKGFEISSIRKTIKYVEKELAGFVDIYFEQANLFSALVGVMAIRGLNSNSIYERHRNADVAQQRFPDLKRKGSGEIPSPQESLECKASKRPWQVQSHYDHPGWYIIWRYLVDPTCSLEENKPVIIWRVDIAFLEKADWKYEASKAGSSGGGRTHTYGLSNPATKLRDKAIYCRHDVVIRADKAVPRNGD